MWNRQKPLEKSVQFVPFVWLNILGLPVSRGAISKWLSFWISLTMSLAQLSLESHVKVQFTKGMSATAGSPRLVKIYRTTAQDWAFLYSRHNYFDQHEATDWKRELCIRCVQKTQFYFWKAQFMIHVSSFHHPCFSSPSPPLSSLALEV